MPTMHAMSMGGGWTMSTLGMRMPSPLRLGAAATFLSNWLVMMVAMMLPSLTPTLWRYRQAVVGRGETRPGRLVMLIGVGYFFVWTAFGLVAYASGVVATTVEMHATLSSANQILVGVVVLLAGALQFTAWKARHLACCRDIAVDELRAEAGAAWRRGLRLGLDCSYCCAGLMAILLAVGAMDLRVMAVVTAAITAERFATQVEGTARTIGVMAIAAGLFLIARTGGYG
jgi:predicted metal-binding membrane protein